MAKLCICWWPLCGPLICDMESRFGLILARLDPDLLSTYCYWGCADASDVIHSFATVMPSKTQFIWLGGFRHWQGFSARQWDTEIQRYNRIGIRTHRKSFRPLDSLGAYWYRTHCIIIIDGYHPSHRTVGSSGVCMICINLANVVDTGRRR